MNANSRRLGSHPGSPLDTHAGAPHWQDQDIRFEVIVHSIFPRDSHELYKHHIRYASGALQSVPDNNDPRWFKMQLTVECCGSNLRVAGWAGKDACGSVKMREEREREVKKKKLFVVMLNCDP